MPVKRAVGDWWSALVITHRYLGIAMSVPMLVWFLSGIVMMYVRYPHITEMERLRTLEPIIWQACCRFGESVIDDHAQVLLAEVENRAGEPVLRIRSADDLDTAVDLVQGTPIQMDADRARAIALSAAQRLTGRLSPLIDAEQIDGDQWTIGLAAAAPLFRFAFGDADRTEIYVSSRTAQVVLWTTSTQRFWNWVGPIPHWLYFASLRGHVVLWSQILIWAAMLGTFLTVLGLYLGIAQIRSRTDFSPYRGWLHWHHVAGLLFGIATFAWVFSGLVSMNPWGFLAERSDHDTQRRLEGPMPLWREVRSSLDMIRKQRNVDAVSVVSAPLGGQLYWLAKQENGTRTRLDAAGVVAPVKDSELAAAAQRVAGSAEIFEQGMLAEEDSYYFQQTDAFELPVYRVILNDEDHSRYYIDPKTGGLLQRVDRNGRWYRWLFGGLHRVDFAPWIRARPIRNIVLLNLLMGGLSLAVAGAYLAAARVRRGFLRSLSACTARDEDRGARPRN
jgi:uncharacterized iron-regulated membrane protein